MRYLSCLLVREGPSDEWFLPTLLKRAVVDLCTEGFAADVEVDVRTLRADHQRPKDVVAAALDERGLFEVLLYHHDGSPPRQAKWILSEMRGEWERNKNSERLVCVVPVRETEAWMLADRPALIRVLSVARLPDSVPGRARDVERVPDPKRVVDESVRSVSARRRAVRRHDPQDYYVRLAEHIDIPVLRRVPAFRQWWDDMTEALEELGYRNG